MKGKIAVVTGAGSGIGAEVCRQLAGAGARVVVMDVNEDAGGDIARNVSGVFIPCNVADPVSWTAALKRCREQVGIPDYAHLNAGVMTVGANEPFATIEQVTLQQYRRIVGVNFDGVVFGLQQLMPLMHNRSDAAITVTASIAGLIALPIDPLYSATKHALIGLVRSIADNLRDSTLRINAICPGGVDTAIVPAALRSGGINMMAPSDIAREVVDLLANGKQGEIRIKLASNVAAYVQPPNQLG